MSGPKDYSPPPSYSMSVFEGRLGEVFTLQSRLGMLRAELSRLCVADRELSINFDCRRELDGMKGAVDSALGLLVFDYKVTFGQDVYNRISREISARLDALRKLLERCEALKAEFARKRLDYDTYRAYLEFRDNSRRSFESFKGRVVEYLGKNLEAAVPDVFREAAAGVGAVRFEVPRVPFEFGFSAKSDAHRQSVVAHVAEREASVNRVRSEASDKALARLGSAARPASQDRALSADPQSPPAELAAVAEKIESLIRDCEDAAARVAHEGSLERLRGAASLQSAYFYWELYDSIFEAEKTRRVKAEVARALARLNDSACHPDLEGERAAAVRLCLDLLAAPSVTISEYEALRLRANGVKRRSRERFEEDEVRRKEHLFLKTQIIVSLENLGYEVMEDLEVIDFDRESDFLLKVAGQENYLNLKFREDGSMRYVFQIPESQDELTTDQKNLKLHEMQVTCDEFQSVLADLSKMGLDVSLRSERPVELDSLVTVPPARRQKLKARAAARRPAQQVRKRYLPGGAG